MYNYSDAELKLINVISPNWATMIGNTIIDPPNLYKLLAVQVFINNRTGPEIEALRRVCKAIYGGLPCRHTPEFDVLCEF